MPIVFVIRSLHLSIFLNKFQFFIFLCYSQFYHTYYRWKSSVLYKNVSSSFFDTTLVVFVCLSLYLSFGFPKYLQFYKLSYVIFNFNMYMLDENLQFYQKMSPFLFFNYILSGLKPYHCICENSHKNLQILHFSYEFP